MSAEKPPSAGNTEYKRWAERLNSYLVRTRSQLAYYVAGQTASEDGVLLWDADNSRLLVSSAGSWVPVVGSGGGGGTITNYLRDDADDSTNFRLTMAGLTVDTDTLYVDSTNNEVGIGTTNPSEKLEVVGNVEATEFIGDLRGAVVFKAQAGEALTKGDVVYISGISGNTTVVSKADADDATKMPAFGLAAKDSSINTNLEVYTFGTLSGIDTSTFTEGDELFVGTTAGALVSTAPTGEGSLVQKIGKVTRSHASAGSIKIMGAGRTNATPNLNDGNIFIGNSSNEAVTASLATQVSTLETSHDDVLVDGDFTSNGFMKRTGAGTYAIDSNTYLTSEANNLTTAVTWANVPDANITQTSVTQHQAALSITENQISDLQTYLTAETNDLSTAVTWANVPDANITETSVTQHQTALSITENQISDLGTYLTASDITGKADLTGATFTGTITAPNVDISTTGTVTTNIATGISSLGSTKTLNLGTGYGGSLAGLTTVNIGSQSTACQNTVNIGSGVSTLNREDTINLKGNVTVDGDISIDGTSNVVAEHTFYNNLSHSQGGTQVLTTTLTTISGNAFDTPSGLGSKHIEFSLDIIYYNVNYTNNGELKVCVEAPNPSSESVINMGTVQVNFNPTSYMRTWAVTGDFTKHLSRYCGLSKNNSSGSTSMGLIYTYRYDASSNYTYVTTGLYTNAPSNGDTIYLHPFDWESQGTSIEGNIYKLDGTTDSTMAMRRDFTQCLGYFTSIVGVSVKAKKNNSSGTHIDNIHIDAIQGKTVKIRN